MEFVPERIARTLLSLTDAIEAVDAGFRALSDGDARVFPFVQCPVGEDGARFGLKSGIMASAGLLGPKLGSYWPSNRARALPNHASSVILLDPETGLPAAFIGASHLTALRTAAADAVAIRALARADASRLCVVGAGHQAAADVRAAALVREIEVVFVWNRDESRAEHVAAELRNSGMDARVTGREAAVREADIIITATASREPLVERAWVREGAHISAMGADGPGKQELSVDLVASATLVADDVEQSVSIGECQAAFRAGAVTREHIRTLGGVLTGRDAGRCSDSEITVFDSSGVAIQDLAICGAAMREARRRGVVVSVY